MSTFLRPKYTYDPPRFRVPELHTKGGAGEMHIENVDGIEVVQARDYDELRWLYEETYGAWMESIASGKP